MDIVCIEVIFVGQLCSIQLADPEIFKVSEITRIYLNAIDSGGSMVTPSCISLDQ